MLIVSTRMVQNQDKPLIIPDTPFMVHPSHAAAKLNLIKPSPPLAPARHNHDSGAHVATIFLFSSSTEPQTGL
jgi:hypothetical protein